MTNGKGAKLRRDIGFFGAAFLVLNAMIGAGIFALPGKVAVNAGMLSPWLFLAVGVVFLAVVLTFAELASYFRESGGPVLYATYAFGPLAGFGTGWILFLSRMTAFAANANVMAIYLGSLFPWFGDGIGRVVVISALTLGLTYANILGVKDGVRTMGFFTILKVLPLLLLVLLGLQHVTTGTLIPSASAVIGDLGGTTLLLIYAYVGFESMAVTAGETAEPRRVLPRALIRTVIGTGILYFLIVLVFVSTIPEDTYADATLVDVGRMLAGPAGAVAITLAAVFSIGGNLAGTMIAAPRLIFALAENKLLPAWFGNVHPKYATPDNSIMVMGGLALVMALTGSFVELAVASSLSRMLSYILCIGSLPVIRNRASDAMRDRAYRIRGGYAVPIVGLAICLWLTAQANAENWRTVGILLAVGFVLYAIERRFLQR
ncbi:MAG: APC family permease [Gammaproteobacteria bacterium]|nr:APC family permease [Gammaproteobacteria bacterium]MDH4005083.1 APC family permease [Gammaproteobacteria bacterium]